MLKSDISRISLPTIPGVYLFKQKSGIILYIGKAKNIKKRLQQYFTPNSLRKQEMVNKAHHVEFITTDTEEESILLETNLITEHKPLYNNLIKGDSAYVYIKIPKEPFPRILLSRYRKNDGAVYIGPKVWKKQLKKTLQIMRTILKYRSCTSTVFKKWTVCSEYFFWLCEGWCAYVKNGKTRERKLKDNKLTKLPPDKRVDSLKHSEGLSESLNKNLWFKKIYNEQEAQTRYNEIIKTISQFFQWDTEEIEEIIQQDIYDAVEQQNFERAAKLRDVYHNLVHISSQQYIKLWTVHSGIFVFFDSLEKETFRTILKLQKGNIIDIISWKDENSITEQLHIIEREYDISFDTKYITIQEQAGTAYHLFPKKINKKELSLLEEKSSQALASFLQSSAWTSYKSRHSLLKKLQKRYYLAHFPHIIECADISHFSGERTVGSITQIQEAVLNKSWYRQYKIHTAKWGDDYWALEELIQKRFTKKRQARPDLFILDGGKWQLQIIKKLLKKRGEQWQDMLKKTSFIALWKWKARKRKGRKEGYHEQIFYFDQDMEIQTIPLRYDTTDRLLLLIRDEAHRFANRYRKKRMEKEYKTM